MSESAAEEMAVLHTNLGDIVLRFFTDKAPGHVANFKKLASEGFYDGTRFHRVIPGFMVQGGDPNSKLPDRGRHGTGGPGYQIKAEFNDKKHVRGILSAARSSDPNSAGSQFFLMVATSTHLDGQYTAYGDGRGFEPFVPKKLGLGFARVEGNPPDFKGINIPSPTGEQLGTGQK